MNSRQIEQCNNIRTELEGYVRMTPTRAHEQITDPRELARWSQSALTVMTRWDALSESLRDDPEATRWLELLRFDRAKIKAGVRAILEVILAKAERETRFAIEKGLSEAATFARIVLEQSQRLESLRAAADKAAGPFPGHKIEVKPEVRKALATVAHGKL